MRRADEGDPAGRYIGFITPRRLLAITSVDIDRPLHNVGYNKQQLGSDWWDDMLKGHPATSGHDAQFNSRCLTQLICMLAPAVIPKQTWCPPLSSHCIMYTFTNQMVAVKISANHRFILVCTCHTNCVDIFTINVKSRYMNLCDLTGSQEVERNQECSLLSCILTFVSLTPVDVFREPLRHCPIVFVEKKFDRKSRPLQTYFLR